MICWTVGTISAVTAVIAAIWIYMTAMVATPEYELLRENGDIQLRRYPDLVVAEVVRPGARREAVSAGFSPLAAYIFARDRTGEKIAMTAPVTQQKTGTDWAIHFIMPGRYDAPEMLPAPAEGSSVVLKTLPGGTRAAIRFSGVATDQSISENEAKLRQWMDREGLKAEGPPVFAYYNDPFTPGPLRRNEVLIDTSG